MEDIGLTSVTFRKKTRQEVMQLAKESKIQFIEWGADVHVPPLDDTAIKEAVALQDQYQIPCRSYGSYFRLLQNTKEEFLAVLETAARLGAGIIRLWMGNQSSKDTTEAAFKKMVQETQVYADLAKERQITLAFEFHHSTYNDSGKTAVRFLKAVHRDNVKTYWQPFTEKADFENLQAVLPYLVTVHVFSWSKSGVRFPLSWLNGRWKRFEAILHAANCQPNHVLEFVRADSPKQFKKDAKTLRSW